MNGKQTYEELETRIPGIVYQFVRHGDGSFSLPYISRQIHLFAGLGPEEFTAAPHLVLAIVHPGDIEKAKQAIKQSVKTMTAIRLEFQCKDPSDEFRWFETEAVPEITKTGDIRWNGIAIDIHRQKQVEKELQEREEWYRTIFQLSNNGVLIFKDGIVDCNQAACDMLQYSKQELIGKTPMDFSPQVLPDGRDAAQYHQEIMGAAFAGHPQTFTWVCYKKDGTPLHMEVTLKAVNVGGDTFLVANCRDLSRQKHMEAETRQYQAQLIQAQRMEAIGTLAGGIAHDFNNLLMGIQGQTSLMSFDLDASHPFSEPITAIQDYIKSASNLTRQLLGLARGGKKFEIKPANINAVVRESAGMFGRTKKEIRIHTVYHSPSPSVMADARQIEQVLLNLYVNAWQAMPNGGELFIKTALVPLNAVFCRPHKVEPGVFAMISVTDTGIGMDTSVMAKVFEPFFTTKEKGKGTGLGLTSVYNIIRNHAGIITVQSEIGRGSSFNIYLPLSERPVKTPPPARTETVTGSETLLLVDDEIMITEVGQGMLEKLGYRVLVANSGHRALEVITGYEQKIDLVILDVIMPDMGGGPTFDRIREIDPSMPVILASGYEIDDQIHDIMERGCNAFIQKPFNFNQLSRQIQQILKGTP